MAGPLVVTENNGHDTPALDGLFSGLRFFVVRRIPQRAYLLDKIRVNGGSVVPLEAQADYIIADHVRKDAPLDSLSYTFIECAVCDGKLPDPNNHRAGPRKAKGVLPPKIATSGRGTRTPFTEEDDRVLYEWVQQSLGQGASVKGNEIYKQLEALNPRHTYQSWRDRYLKKLVDQPPRGTSPRKPTDSAHTLPTRWRVEGEEDYTMKTYDELMHNASDIEGIPDEDKHRAWLAMSRAFPAHSAASWRAFYETIVLPDYLRNRQGKDGNGDDVVGETSATDRNGDGNRREQVAQTGPLVEDSRTALGIPSQHKNRKRRLESTTRDSPEKARRVSPQLRDGQRGLATAKTAVDPQTKNLSASASKTSADVSSRGDDKINHESNSGRRELNSDDQTDASRGLETPLSKARNDPLPKSRTQCTCSPVPSPEVSSRKLQRNAQGMATNNHREHAAIPVHTDASKDDNIFEMYDRTKVQDPESSAASSTSGNSPIVVPASNKRQRYHDAEEYQSDSMRLSNVSDQSPVAARSRGKFAYAESNAADEYGESMSQVDERSEENLSALRRSPELGQDITSPVRNTVSTQFETQVDYQALSLQSQRQQNISVDSSHTQQRDTRESGSWTGSDDFTEAPQSRRDENLSQESEMHKFENQKQQEIYDDGLLEDDELEFSVPMPMGGLPKSSPPISQTSIPESEDENASTYHQALLGDESESADEIQSQLVDTSSSRDSTPIHGKGEISPHINHDLDTQDILNADSGPLDLILPPPAFPDDMANPEVNLYHDGTSDTGSVEITPRSQAVDWDTDSNQDDTANYIRKMKARGFGEEAVIRALKCTSMRPDLAELVLLEEKAGLGLPTDVPGIWSAREDAELEGYDSSAIRRLEQKHSWDVCQARLEFLAKWREMDDE